MPEAFSSTQGFVAWLRNASTTALVALTRLSQMRRLRDSVQRPSAIGAPARLMTASASANTSDHVPGEEGFQLMQAADDGSSALALPAFLERTVTLCPLFSSSLTSGRPINPVPPATMIRMVILH